MTDLVVIVPTRNRPGAIAGLRQAFADTCTADTRLILAVDDNDKCFDAYIDAAMSESGGYTAEIGVVSDPSTMVHALNRAAVAVAAAFDPVPFAIGFLGDDHRPRTKGWDTAYIDALRALGTGIVYGDDLLQGERLPTQCAMTTDIVTALGVMAPPTLAHLAVDNFWAELGGNANCLRYLPDVVVEHMHPAAGKAKMDDGYARANSSEMYRRDLAEFARIRRDELPAAVDAVRALRGQWRLFETDVAEVSTREYHAERERARHLEEDGHRERLLMAAGFVKEAVSLGASSLSDLGCGDGGLLQVVQEFVSAWGYDFTPANAAGWPERNVQAEALDVFGADRHRVKLGDITAVTEVLEHVTDPHGVVRWIGQNSRFIVASSPWDERPDDYTDCHAWAFSQDGYRRLIEQGGYRVLRHEASGRFQVVLAERA